MKEAILSGDWNKIISFVKVYISSSRIVYDPLAYIAFRCAQEWAKNGGEIYLDIAYFLTTYRLKVYMTFAIVLGAFILFIKIKSLKKVRKINKSQ